MGSERDTPDRVGRYEIVLPIAKGGMATVYLARAEGLGGFDRYVALKLTASHLRTDPQFAAHLIEEAKLVAHIRHMNVVPVLDVGEDPLGVFLVMDYVPGDSLSGLIRTAREMGTPLPARIGLRALVDALHGLHAAHEHADEDGHPLHLVHRDFSPQNIIVGTDGIARLTDFGIAKAASRVSNTAQGHIKGKISYVSPEQARALPIDRRCDLWAAGVIAWEILADRKLHSMSGRALLEIIAKAPPRIKEIVPEVPDALDAAIGDVLKVSPDERTPTAHAFARALATAARNAGMLAETDEVAEHVQKLTQRALADRKARIAEARRHRLGSDPKILATKFGVPVLPDAKPRGRLPSLPDVPISRLPDPPTVTAPSIQELGTVDVIVEESESSRGSTPLSLSREQAPPRDAPPEGWLDRKKAIALATACGGVGIVLVIIAIVAAGSGRSSPAAASSASSAIDPSSAPSAAVVAPQASSQAEPQPTPTLDIKANAPIARVRIAGRAIDIDVPAPHVSVELEGDEPGKELAIVATSTDGRIANATAKDAEVAVTFGAKPPPPPPTPPPAINNNANSGKPKPKTPYSPRHL
jgi:eukaryotic-like serine/threonine-protein kinase